MEEVELEDLVYEYPEMDDDNFQQKITAKKEFQDVRAIKDEPYPKRGEAFRHQELLFRYALQYDKLLIISDPGTGKTCSITTITEYYKNLKNTPYKKVYIIAKGKTLLSEIKYQLVCRCTKEETYGIRPRKGLRKEKAKIISKRAIEKLLKEYYQFVTMDSFAKEIMGKSEEDLINEYSGSIFIIDEIHNMRVNLTDVDVTVDSEYNPDADISQKEVNDRKVKMTNVEIYTQIHKLFHLVKRSKILLLSATPMIDKYTEINTILNLLLPMSSQIKTEDFDWMTNSLEDARPYLQGYISYVRALDTGVKIVYKENEKIKIKRRDLENPITKTTVPSQSKIYAVQMSKFQDKHYAKLFGTRTGKTGGNSVYLNERQALNLVFPGGEKSVDGFKKYVKPVTREKKIKVKTQAIGKKQKKQGKQKEGIVGEEVTTTIVKGEYKFAAQLDEILGEQELKKYSAKFAEIVRICNESKGNCWIYINFVRGAGAIVLGRILEKNGFQKFSAKTSIFKMGQNAKTFCEAETFSMVDRTANIEKAPRYGILTAGLSDEEWRIILETQNSYENRHGDYLKVVIGTPISRDGLNLSNVVTIIMVEPYWNESASFQAQSRAIRALSHVALIKEAEKKTKDPKQAKVEIAIYRMAAVSQKQESVDLMMYELAESKNIEIKQVFRIMKQYAIDCQLNYSRNVHTKDKDWSPEADYSIAKYKCINKGPTELDKTSYLVLYANKEIQQIQNDIRDFFRQQSIINVYDIYNDLADKYDMKVIILAIVQMVEQKIPVIDRFGYQTFIYYDNATLFLQRIYPIQYYPYNMAYYTQNLYGIQRKKIKDYLQVLPTVDIKDVLTDLLDTPNLQDLYTKLDELKPDQQAEIVEFLIIQKEEQIANEKTGTSPPVQTKKKKSPKDKKNTATAILEYFDSSILKVNEMTDVIEKVNKKLHPEKRGRGKPTDKPKIVLTPEELVENPKNDVIHLHKIYTNTAKKTRYAATTDYFKVSGRLRIYKPKEENGWRDLNPAENIVYHAVFQEKMNESVQKFKENEIYGTIIDDQIFRIVDNRIPSKNKKGTACNNLKKGQILDILRHLNSKITAGTKKELCNNIHRILDEKNLIYYS